MKEIFECFEIIEEMKAQDFTSREEVIVKLNKHLPGMVENALKTEHEREREANFGIVGLMILEVGKKIIEVTEKEQQQGKEKA